MQIVNGYIMYWYQTNQKHTQRCQIACYVCLGLQTKQQQQKAVKQREAQPLVT